MAAIIYAANCFTQASPSSTVPSNALGSPTASAFIADNSISTSAVSAAGVPLSSPTSGQISFRTKTRNGMGGVWHAVCSREECALELRLLAACVRVLVLPVWSPSARRPLGRTA